MFRVSELDRSIVENIKSEVASTEATLQEKRKSLKSAEKYIEIIEKFEKGWHPIVDDNISYLREVFDNMKKRDKFSRNEFCLLIAIEEIQFCVKEGNNCISNNRYHRKLNAQDRVLISKIKTGINYWMDHGISFRKEGGRFFHGGKLPWSLYQSAYDKINRGYIYVNFDGGWVSLPKINRS